MSKLGKELADDVAPSRECSSLQNRVNTGNPCTCGAHATLMTSGSEMQPLASKGQELLLAAVGALKTSEA